MNEEMNKLQKWKERAAKFEGKIEEFVKNGVGYKPNNDMILYCQVVTPKLTEEELEGSDPLVLSAMFDGDQDGDVTTRKLYLIAKGDKCETNIPLGKQIVVRGNAFAVHLPEGMFLTVREYDIVGHHE